MRGTNCADRVRVQRIVYRGSSAVRCDCCPVHVRCDSCSVHVRCDCCPVHVRCDCCPVHVRCDSCPVHVRCDSCPVHVRCDCSLVHVRCDCCLVHVRCDCCLVHVRCYCCPVRLFGLCPVRLLSGPCPVRLLSGPCPLHGRSPGSGLCEGYFMLWPWTVEHPVDSVMLASPSTLQTWLVLQIAHHLRPIRQTVYVWDSIVARSRNVYTSSAVLTVWCHFTGIEQFYGDLASPTIIRRI